MSEQQYQDLTGMDELIESGDEWKVRGDADTKWVRFNGNDIGKRVDYFPNLDIRRPIPTPATEPVEPLPELLPCKCGHPPGLYVYSEPRRTLITVECSVNGGGRINHTPPQATQIDSRRENHADRAYCAKCFVSLEWNKLAARATEPVTAAEPTPEPVPSEVGGTHYQQGVRTSPWDLQRTMQSSGSAFVDARRADILKYAFRLKGDNARLLEDLRKAADCCAAAVAELERLVKEDR